MLSVTIISPHQDDAALSLSRHLSIWSQTPGINVRIVNCFTVSCYCPFKQANTVDEVSALRAAEDMQFNTLACADNLQIINLGLVDSLFRMSETDVRRVLEHRELDARDMLVVSSLKEVLAPEVSAGVVLVPLGVGHHIDHRIVTRASIELQVPSERLLFYLDVPYWLRVPPEDVRDRLFRVESFVEWQIQPFSSTASTTFYKWRLLDIYSSQLRKEDVAIATQAPFEGEVLLGVPDMPTQHTLSFGEVSWTVLNI